MLYFTIENMYKLIHTHFHEAVTGNGGCFIFCKHNQNTP